MSQPEFTTTAFVLSVAGLLLLISALASRASDRLGVPVVVVFMLVGMAAGSEGLGGIHFENYQATFRVGTAALVLILFDGGLNTPAASVRTAIAPASVLATVGVAITAGLLGVIVHLVGFDWPQAMLLGAVVSSTDAAAVFTVLRSSGLQLKRRVGTTLEMESGLNDPMAVILTLALTHAISEGRWPGPSMALMVLVQLVVGIAAGLAIGWLARRGLRRLHLQAAGLYPVVTAATALLAFGIATLAQGSGFLAVYVAGLVLGNGPLPYRQGVLRVHDSAAWVGQIVMFLAMGLLVFPSQLLTVVGSGIAVALGLALIARPLAVVLCLLPFRYSAREQLYVSWVGLRGAVPIVLATIPVLSGVRGGAEIFTIVFFVVVVSATLQGGTVRWLTRRLKLEARAPPPPPASVEITSKDILETEILHFYVGKASAVANASVEQLPLTGNAAVVLITRGGSVIAPGPQIRILPGDHVYVVGAAGDRPLLSLLFGQEEE